MGAMQRNKGIAGERAVAILIRDWLGLDVRRNWQQQAAEGGSDLTGIPGWAVEVKWAKEWRSEWWDQCCRQAVNCERMPALIWLIDGTRRGQPPIERWRVMCPLNAISRYQVENQPTMEISLGAWMCIAREILMEREQVNPSF